MLVFQETEMWLRKDWILFCNEKFLTVVMYVECKSKSDNSIFGVTGTSSKSFINYLSKVLGNHEIKDLRQRAIFGTEHILQNVM